MKRKAGEKAGLTRKDVVAAAAELADAEGLAVVTMASVAGHLGVRSPSLYAHVDGLAGLRRLLALKAASAMARSLGKATVNRAGEDSLRAIAGAYRRFNRSHPGLYDAAQQAVRLDEDEAVAAALRAAIEPVLDALAEAGVPEGERIHLTRAIRSALHGFVTLEKIGGFGLPESVDSSFERLVDLVIAGVRESARPRREPVETSRSDVGRP